MLKIPPRQGLLALLLAALCLPASAQTPTTPSEQDRAKFGHFFEPVLLDSRLTTGRLLDAAMPLTDVTVFTGLENLNGAEPVDSDTPAQQRPGLPPQQPSANAETWRLAYGALLTGAVPAQPHPLTELRAINNDLDTEPLELYDGQGQRHPVVDLLLAYVPYQHLRADALSAGLLTVATPDSQLVPVPGAASPFQEARAFVAAPARLAVYGSDILFHYQPSRFFVNGSGRQFTTLQIDFGDGQGLQAVPPDTYVRALYGQTGRVTLHFVLTDAAGASVHAYGHLMVAPDAPPVARPTGGPSVGYDADSSGNNRAYHFPLSDTYFPNHEASSTYFNNQIDATYGPVLPSIARQQTINPPPLSGLPSVTVHWREVPDGATVTVSYGGNRNINAPGARNGNAPIFKKPIIIVEGFDSWKLDGNKNYNFETFLNEELRGITNVYFIAPSGTNPGVRFSTQLADHEYDLIFVDFVNGTGDIRRNAMIVANVVEWVSAHYDPTLLTQAGPAGRNVPDQDHKITIIGQSMGGLVARFALGYLDHGTTVLAGQHTGTATSFIQQAPQAHPGATAFVKLLVTRDSPHRGANTPPGLQIAVRKLANLEVGRFVLATPLVLPWAALRLEDMVERLRKANALLYEPAALQLILYQDDRTPNLIVPGTHTWWWALLGPGKVPLSGGFGAGNGFRDTQYRPMITYTSGQTPTYATAALSNGSECGTPQPHPAYSEIARLEAHFYANPIVVPIIQTAGTLVAAGASVIPYAGPPAAAGIAFLTTAVSVAVSTLTGKDLDTEVIINGLPDPSAGSKRIWHAKIKMRIEIFPFLHFWPFKKVYIPIRLFASDADSPPGMPSYDNAPGGYYQNDPLFQVPTWLNTHGLVRALIESDVHFQMQDDFCFVPTASAIDYNGPSTTYQHSGQVMMGQDVITRGFTDDHQTQNRSRFQNFVTQEPSHALRQNTRHIQFTTRSARFVYGLITNNASLTAASCAVTCGVAGVSIVGPNNVCAGGATYTASPVLPNVGYEWGIPAGLREISRSADSSSITLDRINPNGAPSAGPQVITLDVARECQSFAQVTKTVWALDAPIPPAGLDSEIGHRVPCHYDRLTVRTPVVPGAETYDWTSSVATYTNLGALVRTYNYPAVSGSPTPPGSVSLQPSQPNQYVLYRLNLTMRSNCGTPAITRTYLARMDATRYDPDGTCHGHKPGADDPDPIEVYPNAADEKFVVELVDDSVEIWPADPALVSEFKLYDMYGVEQVAKTEPTKETEIWTQNLPNGPYILRVWRGGRYEMKAIYVQH